MKVDHAPNNLEGEHFISMQKTDEGSRYRRSLKLLLFTALLILGFLIGHILWSEEQALFSRGDSAPPPALKNYGHSLEIFC